MAELAEEAARKEIAVGNSIILTTNVIGFLMNLKSPKLRNFIMLIDSLFHTGSKPHGCAYH